MKIVKLYDALSALFQIMHCHLYLIQICIISNRSAQQDYLWTKLFFPNNQYETTMELNFFDLKNFKKFLLHLFAPNARIAIPVVMMVSNFLPLSLVKTYVYS